MPPAGISLAGEIGGWDDVGLTLVIGALGVVLPVLSVVGAIGLVVGVIPVLAYVLLVSAYLFGEHASATSTAGPETGGGDGSAGDATHLPLDAQVVRS